MSEFRKLVPAAAASAEIKVVNSVFIADLKPVSSVEEARAFLLEVRKRYPDATHHVPAFVIGHGNSTILHSSDDGEPSGTAGRPALAVLQGSGLGNAAVVVTRYFGGTKLGTGGLVKAYGEAVKAVLAVTRQAELLPTTTLRFVAPYRLYDQVVRLMDAQNGRVLSTDFLEEITVSVQFKDTAVEAFKNELGNLSAGQIETIIVEQDPESVFPLT